MGDSQKKEEQPLIFGKEAITMTCPKCNQQMTTKVIKTTSIDKCSYAHECSNCNEEIGTYDAPAEGNGCGNQDTSCSGCMDCFLDLEPFCECIFCCLVCCRNCTND